MIIVQIIYLSNIRFSYVIVTALRVPVDERNIFLRARARENSVDSINSRAPESRLDFDRARDAHLARVSRDSGRVERNEKNKIK